MPQYVINNPSLNSGYGFCHDHCFAGEEAELTEVVLLSDTSGNGKGLMVKPVLIPLIFISLLAKREGKVQRAEK